MKQILITIIMIVSSCVSGQSDTFDWHGTPPFVNYDNTSYYQTMPYITYQDNTFDDIGTLIEQYQSYKLECYNDSTIRYINPIPEGHSHVHYVNWYTEAQCNDNHTRTYWKHKTPTFDGFMNYFNKKTYK